MMMQTLTKITNPKTNLKTLHPLRIPIAIGIVHFAVKTHSNLNLKLNNTIKFHKIILQNIDYI
jgi:hypothetical protein